jgi:TRAP-type mannitol/chloroaromatic compound transport system permease small subunit
MLNKSRRVERINAWTSAISSWSLLAMTLFVAFEVISRYVFNSPTIWAWDVNVQLMLLLLMMGIAEAYRRDVHVRVDVLTGMLTPRQNAWINVVMAPVFFFITVVLVITCWLYFLDSYERMENASTLFAPPLYPIKFFMPLGSALLLLQGAVNLVRDLRVALGYDDQPTRGES